MVNDNIKMWTELNIDLKSPNILLSALGPIFREVYLSFNRPIIYSSAVIYQYLHTLS